MGRVFNPALTLPETEWELVEAASAADAPTNALEGLLRRYMRFLEAYVSSQFWLPADQAKDWLQSFVLEKMIARDFLLKADRARGKFRNFLLRSLHNYIVQQMRREAAHKRAPENMTFPIHALPENELGDSGADYEHELDVAWARGVLSEALRRMRQECRASRREDLWGVFDGRLLRPLIEESKPVNYEALVRQFDFRSVEQASNALMTAKRMFARQLRFLISEYAATETAVETEIAELKQILIRVGAQLPIPRSIMDKELESLGRAQAAEEPAHPNGAVVCPEYPGPTAARSAALVLSR